MSESLVYWRPIGRSEYLVNVVNRVAAPFVEGGVDLTPPQVFGLLLEEGLVEDTSTDYNRLLLVLNRGHLSGRIDWSIGKDTSFHFFGEEGGVEVWVERDDLVRATLAALHGLRGGVMVTRGEPSTSSVYQAVQRNPKFIIVVGHGANYKRRLTEIGFEGEVVGLGTELGPWERMDPGFYGRHIRNSVVDYFAETSGVVDLGAEIARYEEDVERGDRVLGRVRARLQTIETGLVEAMASVGDTTRAIALKKKIDALLEEA